MGQTENMKQNTGILVRALGVSLVLALLPIAAFSLTPKVPLIELNATGASPQMGRGSSLAAEGASDKMMMPNPFSYTYVAGEKLSDQGGNGKVYKVILEGDPKDVLTNIAKALGLGGTVYESDYSTPQYPTFQIGSKDGSGPAAVINWAGTGNWWFNDPSAYPSAKCIGFQKAEDGSEYCASYEEQKPTPGLIPSKNEILSAALKMFNATGLKAAAGDIRIDVTDWGASASASLKVDGNETPIEWYMNWGSNGKLGSVSGNSVRFVEQGTLSTISEKAAVARMSDWRYSGQISSSIWSKYAPPVRTGEPGMIAYDTPAENGDAPEPVLSPEPVSSPKPIIVKVNEAHAVSMLIWDRGGSAWLVPGYVLIGDQGWLTPVFSLEEGVVALPEPVITEPGVPEPLDVSPMVK
jgi:hypothetical protein